MATPFVKVRRYSNYAVLSVAKEPVNSLDTELWRQLKAAFDGVEADAHMRGVIFASGLARDVFTAGNDVNELYAPRTSLERYREFWVLSNHFLAQVYASRLVTLSAIKGACPAGGCCLSLCCDVRLMSLEGHIGLNEVALGIPVPLFWARLMARVIGEGPAERLCKTARLVSPQEALKLGLVDQVVNVEVLAMAAEAMMQQLLQHPDGGRQLTKAGFRADFAREWREFAVTEPEGAWRMLCEPSTVKALEAYMAQLRAKAKSKPSKL